MNKDIKITWKEVKKGIAQAEKWGACDEVIEDLKAIKTLEEFLAFKGLPYCLYWYADKLAKGRIEAFEKIISNNARWSYMYCKYVAGCRIPAMEASIATDAYESYLYCKYVAECRIPAMEAAIANDALCRYWYCQYVAKCRIPELEAAIKKDGYYWERYLNLPEERK